MSLRDIAVIGLLLVLIPVSFLRPWIGVLTWTWVGYMNPHRLTFGFLRHAPVAMIVGAATLLGIFTRRERARLPVSAEVVLLFALWIVFLLSSVVTAIYPEDAWHQFNLVSKILLMTLVTIALIRTRTKLTALFAVVAIALGFYGLKAGIWTIRTAGQFHVEGPEGTFIGGNTEIALALNMNLPILLYLRRQLPNRWLRHFVVVVFLFSIVAIISTYSRGGFLGLAAVLFYLAIRSRRRFLAISLIAVGVIVGASLVPEKWTSRMETIQNYQEDGSAMGRIRAWEFSMRIAEARPLFGGGFRCFTSEVQSRYMPETFARGFDAHNIFFQMLGEHGYTGLVLYIALILVVLGSLHRISKVAGRRSDLLWIKDYSQMIQGSLVGYLVSGFFLSLSYFDLFYLLVAGTAILKQLLAEEVRRSAEVEQTAALQPLPAA